MIKKLAVQPYLLLHAGLQQHHHAGLDGQGDLAVAPLQVLLQSRAERRLLRPGVWQRTTIVFAKYQ